MGAATMSSKNQDTKTPKGSRAERLAEELRANLRKRKTQLRARQSTDERPEDAEAVKPGTGEA